jgi:class 3 adenylate cyclase
MTHHLAAPHGELFVNVSIPPDFFNSLVTFDDRGEHTLKGVGEPQRLFAVRGGG